MDGHGRESTIDAPVLTNRQRALRLPSGRRRAETLADYRWLWRTYHEDPDLQRLHARHTVLPIWDDHEFANDGYGVHDTDTDDPDDKADPARRSAASRAWTEYQPAHVTFDGDAARTEQLRIYRSFVFGGLVELALTDERLYRDGPPCGPATRDRYATTGCEAMFAEGRTMLGLDIVYPLTTEPWGVRRFFVRSPDGNVINVVRHREQ